MILAVDIGNSNIVLGGYVKGAIQFTARISAWPRREADEYAVELAALLALNGIDRSAIEGIALCSVVPRLTSALTQALQKLCTAPLHRLSLADAQGLTIAIYNPEELGMDLLAGALAVRHTRPLPALIIDMGTATKLTALDASGTLRGVSIAPGLFLSLDALVKNASLLGGIPLTAPPAVAGRNSAESMQSGVILGNACMLDGMIDRFAAELGGAPTVVATGGAAPLVVPHCRHSIELCDTLILDGLYQAYRHKAAAHTTAE